MVSWKKEYNEENLKEACECLGMAPSQLELVEITEVSLKDIQLMWYGHSVLEHERQERGWGQHLPIKEVQQQLKEIYKRNFLATVEDLDPVIVIDGALFDGWGRSSLAHALGEGTVRAAMFSVKKDRKESIYLTYPQNFEIAKAVLKDLFEYEMFNHGLIIYFDSKESKNKAIALLDGQIDGSYEGNWKF